MGNLILVNGFEKHLFLVKDIFQLIYQESEKGSMCSQSQEVLKEQILKGDAILAFWDSEWVAYCYIQLWKHYSEICGSVVKIFSQ